MNGAKRLTWMQATLGDIAVDGLLAGLGAGIAMAIVLVVVGLFTGEMPWTLFARFDPSGRAQPFVGILAHLAVAGVYGLLFGLVRWGLRRRLSRRTTVLALGLIYGIALYVLAETVLLPSTHSPLLAISVFGFALGHVAYGATLGWLMSREVLVR